MPNIIEIQSQEIPQQNISAPADQLIDSIGLKNLEFLQYLGKKDDLFNRDVMEKIKVLAEYFPNVDALMDRDLTLGEKNGMTRLDKLYSFVLLDRQVKNLEEKRNLIIEARDNVTS